MLQCIFNGVVGLQAFFITMGFPHKCFPVKFAKLLQTFFFHRHPENIYFENSRLLITNVNLTLYHPNSLDALNTRLRVVDSCLI